MKGRLMGKSKAKRKARTMYAWVVFYLYEDGTEYCADSIGRSKEEAWERFKKLYPDSDSPAWKCRRVKMEVLSRRGTK